MLIAYQSILTVFPWAERFVQHQEMGFMKNEIGLEVQILSQTLRMVLRNLQLDNTRMLENFLSKIHSNLEPVSRVIRCQGAGVQRTRFSAHAQSPIRT